MIDRNPITQRLRRPSAWLPFALSLAALALVVGYALLVPPRIGDGDETAVVRIFWLLLGVQVPIALWFIATSDARRPWLTVAIVVAQVVAALVPLVLVSWLEG